MATTHGSAVLHEIGDDDLDFPGLKERGISAFILGTNGRVPLPDPRPQPPPVYERIPFVPPLIIPPIVPALKDLPDPPPPSAASLREKMLQPRMGPTPSSWTLPRIAAVPVGGFAALLFLWYLVDSSIAGRLIFAIPLAALSLWLWTRKPHAAASAAAPPPVKPAPVKAPPVVVSLEPVPAPPNSPEYLAAHEVWFASTQKQHKEWNSKFQAVMKSIKETLAYGVSWVPRVLKGMAVSFGAARSGKGVSTIVPALLSYVGSVVALDVKAELAAICAQRRRDLGQNTVIIDPFGEVNRVYGEAGGWTETITKYNPLADLDPTAITFSDDIAATGEALCLDDRSGANGSFFSGAARELTNGLVAAVVQRKPGRGTLREVREFLTMDNQEFAAACVEICKDFPGTLAEKKLARFKVVNKTNDGVRDTAAQQTAFLDSEELLQAMEPGPNDPPFSFSALTAKNGPRTSVFIVCPLTHLPTHQPWLRLLIMQSMRQCLRYRNTGPDPVLFLLDEAGTSLGHLSVIENAYGQSSGLGILCWSFYQDINQLRRDYPSSWQTFIGNSIMIQVIAARDQDTVEYFSRYMGNFTDKATTESTSTNEGNSSGSGSSTTPDGGSSSRSDGRSYGTSISTSTGPVSRPIKFPDEIRNLDPKKLIIFFPGVAQYCVYQQVYYTDPRYAGLFRPDPTYPPPQPVIEAKSVVA